MGGGVKPSTTTYGGGCGCSNSNNPSVIVFLAVILVIPHLIPCTNSGPPGLESSDQADNDEPLSDSAILLEFKDSLKDETGALSSWNASKLPCVGPKNIWAGIVCSKGGNVWGLRLENMNLGGKIDVDTLSKLGRLRSLSVKKNNLGGEIPDFSKMKSLKGIFLGQNNFEGPIDSVKWEGLRRLRKLNLNDNKFNGEIPKSLTKLNKLLDLQLQNNQFDGLMPDFSQLKSLKFFNVSNNNLTGRLPPSIADKFEPSSYQGNEDLCGGSLKPCPPGTPDPPKEDPKQKEERKPQPKDDQRSPQVEAPAASKSNSEKPVPVIALVAGVVVAMVLAILIILLLVRKPNNKDEDSGSRGLRGMRHSSSLHQMNVMTKTYKVVEVPDEEHSVRSTTSTASRHAKAENGKLTFLRDRKERFDLPDLLKAAAEILGSGCFGSTYKATLNNGNAVVVKRFKQMNNVGREEFQEHMRRLGKLSHTNLLPLVAYYYRKEEKLFITEPMQRGSLAMLLHGQTRGKPTMDWPTRLKVIKGVAKGVAELYKELPVLVAPHGHLKSSNVLLNGAYEAVLSDYGLIPLINQESAQEHMVAYKSPEYFNNGRVTKKTDVWALGILIVETMTGKFPSAYLQEGSKEVDMASWVDTVVAKGFDTSMGQIKNSDGEMQKLLDIGLRCCESNVEKRLDIKEACELIEEVKERDNDDDFYSAVEGDTRSSRGTSVDFTMNIIT